MRTLYGIALSPFVRKVRVVLAEKALPYRHEPVLHYLVPGDFVRVSRKISPLGKIPAYEEGPVTLADSSVICSYLERAHPEPALYPSEPYDYARALWFEEYGDSALASVLTGRIFFRGVVLPHLQNQPRDDAVIRGIADTELPPLFDYLEGVLDTADALVGNRFSIADIGVATQFVNLRSYAGIGVDARRWPRLACYLAHVLARPSFEALIAEELSAFGLARGESRSAGDSMPATGHS